MDFHGFFSMCSRRNDHAVHLLFAGCGAIIKASFFTRGVISIKGFRRLSAILLFCAVLHACFAASALTFTMNNSQYIVDIQGLDSDAKTLTIPPSVGDQQTAGFSVANADQLQNIEFVLMQIPYEHYQQMAIEAFDFSSMPRLKAILIDGNVLENIDHVFQLYGPGPVSDFIYRYESLSSQAFTVQHEVADGDVHLKWTSFADWLSFDIERTETDLPSAKLIFPSIGPVGKDEEVKFVDSSAEPGKSYQYLIRISEPMGSSIVNGFYVKIPPAAPASADLSHPSTGDDTPIHLYAALMAVSIVLLLYFRRRKE